MNKQNEIEKQINVKISVLQARKSSAGFEESQALNHQISGLKMALKIVDNVKRDVGGLTLGD